jgi:hypothetical protein
MSEDEDEDDGPTKLMAAMESCNDQSVKDVVRRAIDRHGQLKTWNCFWFYEAVLHTQDGRNIEIDADANTFVVSGIASNSTRRNCLFMTVGIEASNDFWEKCKIIVLILIARRRRVRHLPDELWLHIREEHDYVFG